MTNNVNDWGKPLRNIYRAVVAIRQAALYYFYYFVQLPKGEVDKKCDVRSKRISLDE